MGRDGKKKLNILFIMTDQQRVDYLSIYGNKVLHTPAMDRIGSEGTVFENAYVQSAVCGPSRACFYTGRYVHTHNSRWNEVPLPITEKTAGHYFEEAGYRAAVIGKTHMFADFPKPAFVKESSISPNRRNLSRMDSVGFEYITGAISTPAVPANDYLDYLKNKGYQGEGYQLIQNTAYKHNPGKEKDYQCKVRCPAVIRAEDSEAHYLTDRAMQFMKETSDCPWFLHLSYVRPHHPNIAPFPYNEMYPEQDFPEPVRSEAELSHPLFGELREERNVGKGDVNNVEHCRHWRAVYAGLIKEIDDNLMRLFKFMEEKKLLDNTMIIFTSDHGELAGDHWFFEKEMCYRQSHQVSLLIRHPDLPEGVTAPQFVESIDILPTCLEAAGLKIPAAIQGKSLLPLMSGEKLSDWRQDTFAEWTFEYYNAPVQMGLTPERCRAIMIRNEQYSYCHFNGLPDLLFDLQKDPNELNNIADDPAYESAVHELKTKIIDWQLSTWDPLPLRIDTGWPRKTGKGPAPKDLPYNFSRFTK